MHIGLIAAPTEQRYYTDTELECWRNLHILRYQIQFREKLTVSEFLQLENVRNQHNGLLSIAAVLLKEGFNTTYYYPTSFLNIDFESLASMDIVAISSVTSNYLNAKKMAIKIKSISPNTKIIIGGHHAPYLYEEILNDPECKFDYIVRGYAEQTILKLVRIIETGGDVSDIDGVAFLQNGKIVNKENKSVPNLNQMPFPSHEMVKEDLIGARVYSMYGCAYNCVFCNLGKGIAYSMKDIQLLEKELLFLKENKKTKFIYFGDPTFSNDPQRLKNISSLMKELGLWWQMQTRISSLNTETLNILEKDSFLVGVDTGVESMNDHLLRSIRKGTTGEKSMEVMQEVAKRGINLLCYWLFGLPGTTPDIAQEEFASMNKLLQQDILIHLNLVMPYPGSDFFHNPEAHGIKIISRDWDQYYSGGNMVHHVDKPVMDQYYQGLELMNETALKRIKPEIYDQFREFEGITIYRGLF